jgi:hypothetical protein
LPAIQSEVNRKFPYRGYREIINSVATWLVDPNEKCPATVRCDRARELDCCDLALREASALIMRAGRIRTQAGLSGVETPVLAVWVARKAAWPPCGRRTGRDVPVFCVLTCRVADGLRFSPNLVRFRPRAGLSRLPRRGVSLKTIKYFNGSACNNMGFACPRSPGCAILID